MISGADLKILLTNEFSLNDVLVWGSEYSLPDEDWLANEFSASFKRNLEALGLTYTSQSFVCTGFALLGMLLGVLENVRSGNKRRLALGILTYNDQIEVNDDGHAVLVTVVKRPSGDVILTYEPQTQKFVELTPLQKLNAISLII